MEIQFFPLDLEYQIKNEVVWVYLYGLLEQGGKICVRQQHRPFLYAQAEGVDEELLASTLSNVSLPTAAGNAKVVSWEKVERELLGQKSTFFKLYTNYPQAVPVIARELESAGMKCYERDILFVHRYLRDTKIIPMTLVKASGEFTPDDMLRVPLFSADEITQVSLEAVQQPSILAIDIETYAKRREIDPLRNPILMIGLYGVKADGKEFRKVLTWKKFSHTLEYLEQVSDEVELLQRFCRAVKEFQPDIITGYFSDGFDFPYLKSRADYYNITLDLGLDNSELIAGKIGSSRDGEARIRGILHLDMLKFIRNIFGKDLKTDSYSLDAVSEELLGHGKHKVNLDELAHTWDEMPEKLSDYCAYNLHDAHLAYRLCQKLLPDMIEFTKIVGLPTFDIIRMRFSRLVENYILKRAIEYNVIAPNKPSDYESGQRREDSIQGAYVYEPTPGLYKDIAVFDFRSLYPTIITAHNIGPEGFRCSCCHEQEHVPDHEDYWFCQQDKKFIPTVLEQLILRRVDLKRLIKEQKQKAQDTKILEARSYALKTLANSFYGYLGFFGARWYCLECAAATTAYARNYIKTTIAKAQERGFKVIYADTDSCFLLLEGKILDQALEFMNEINFDLPGHMELDFQGHYPQGLFVAQKGSEKGAKKKYALIDEQGKIKITGFETVRRNWSAISKEVQEKVLLLILSERVEEAITYVREVVAQLQKGLVPVEKLIIKTQITRELEGYTSIGPHVAIARKMAERGDAIVPGTVVEYVIAKGVGLVRDRAMFPEDVTAGNYDATYYIQNQLLPAVLSIFAVLGHPEEDLFSDSSQTGLGKFF